MSALSKLVPLVVAGAALAFPLLSHPENQIKDADGDGVPTDADNCPYVSNPGQRNLDGDCFGDACDADDDGDGLADDEDPCHAIANTGRDDYDGDGLGDRCDNCPSLSNPRQEDDGEVVAGEWPDGVGDVCDPHPVTGGDLLSAVDPFFAAALTADVEPILDETHHLIPTARSVHRVERTGILWATSGDAHVFIEVPRSGAYDDLPVAASRLVDAWRAIHALPLVDWASASRELVAQSGVAVDVSGECVSPNDRVMLTKVDP